MLTTCVLGVITISDESLKKALRLSYLLSFILAMLVGAGFLAVTSLTGDYGALARYGGTVWTFILALIIALPTITPPMKRRFRSR